MDGDGPKENKGEDQQGANGSQGEFKIVFPEMRGENRKTAEKEKNVIYTFIERMEPYDLLTCVHSEKVAGHMTRFSRFLRLPHRAMCEAYMAGILHDVGKMAVPKDVLQKKGPLTDDEWRVMKRHPIQGVEMLRRTTCSQKLLAAIANHHERFDGKGYPAGKKGWDIPFLGRMLALCDSFEAMVGVRHYRKPLQIMEAIDEIVSQSGKQYDPLLAAMFCEHIWAEQCFSSSQASRLLTGQQRNPCI